MIPGYLSEIRVPTSVQGNEGDQLDFRVWPDENGLLGRYALTLFGDLLFLLRFLLSLPNNVWRLIVFAPFLIIIIIIIIILSFHAPWTCPWQISGTTGQNFMKRGGVIDLCL